jgi:putative membrane protein
MIKKLEYPKNCLSLHHIFCVGHFICERETPMKHLKTSVLGLLYGIASPIPGLDGGTFFILFNVYEDLIHSANLTNIRKKLPIVLLFLVGCAVGLLVISNLMMYLLANHGMIMYFSFAGLILGCVPMIYKKSALNVSKYKISFKNFAIFAIALALMLVFAFGTQPDTFEYITPIYETSAGLAWLFFASAISSVGMLIPGVGGAILMLVLGIYTIYIEALANLNWVILITFATSMAVGILCGIKIVRKILVKYPGELYCAILGFTIGSVFVVLPGFSASLEGVLAIVSAAVFTVAAYQFSKRG